MMKTIYIRLPNRLIYIASILATLIFFGRHTPAAIGSTPAPTATSPAIQIQSLFDEDICSPPCWFGLIPGQTTTQEVVSFIGTADENMFHSWSSSSSSQFDVETDYVINGQYSFYWNSYTRQDIGQSNSGLVINNGKLDQIWILMPRAVLLGDVIERLGQPSRIRFGTAIFLRPLLVLDYHDIQLRVEITGPMNCTMYYVAENFWVNSVSYYSPRYVEEFNWVLGLPGAYFELPDVPIDLWQTWLYGGVKTSCADAGKQLYNPSFAPTQTAMLPFGYLN